jgi:ATPase subunit of ABC transporter with duplicated ATPase domains
MTLITLKDLGVTLGAPLFAGLSLTISKHDRIGLVAANGRGKSTLLRCLAGTHEPENGDLTRARGLKAELVGQDVPGAMLQQTFREAALGALSADNAESESWRADVALDELAVPDGLRGRRLGELSGGWQRVALLARGWVAEPDLLLLDEPTNHLDLERIGFLQNWLATAARSTPFMVASHDRAFLDAVTNKTLFLRETGSQIFSLAYSPAREALAQSDAAQERRFGNDMKQAQQLRRQAAKLNNIGINSGSDLLVVKTRQLKERAQKLENAARPAFQERSAGKIKLSASGAHAKALITLENADVTAPDGRLLFKTGNLWISPGDRIALLGRNGSGKTMLMSVIHRAIGLGGAAAVKAAPAIALGHADQSLSHLDSDATPMAALTRRFSLSDPQARALLAGAGIGFDLQQARTRALSGGQKARLAMLVLRLQRPNFYLLDEPTNHLDIEGQEALEAELTGSEAACLLVSHDRTFVRNAANRFWVIEGRKLVEADAPDAFFKQMLAPG